MSNLNNSSTKTIAVNKLKQIYGGKKGSFTYQVFDAAGSFLGDAWRAITK